MKDIVIIANFCRDFSETDNGRFMYLCKELSKENRVEIITSDFSHGLKKHKDPLKNSWPFRITFLHEPGYKKNICLQRFISHYAWGNAVAEYVRKRDKPDVIYCAVPSLTAPNRIAKYCKKNNVKFVIDIQDLWPEAFKMVFDIPLISTIVFAPIKHRADEIYKHADAICGVSQKYVDLALSVNSKCDKGHVVFLGTDLEAFDSNAKKTKPKLEKLNREELWLGYCGSLAASYDIPCVISALKIIKDQGKPVPKFILMGDGAKRAEFEKAAVESGIDAVFLGSLPYDQMCAQLVQCDMVVNPIVKGSAASIINKHGDYASSGLPVLNTQESTEYRTLVDQYNMGFNCKNGNARDLADKLLILVSSRTLRQEMGLNARRCAEEKFDRRNTYKELIEAILL